MYLLHDNMLVLGTSDFTVSLAEWKGNAHVDEDPILLLAEECMRAYDWAYGILTHVWLSGLDWDPKQPQNIH